MKTLCHAEIRKNRDARATRNQGFDRAIDAGEQTVVSPRASVIAR